MLMKNNYCAFSCIFWMITVPVMPDVSGHYGHIIIIDCDDVEILGIKALQILCIKNAASFPSNHATTACSTTDAILLLIILIEIIIEKHILRIPQLVKFFYDLHHNFALLCGNIFGIPLLIFR